MEIIGKNYALELLTELQHNCGDIRGRDGEYLDTQVEKIVNAVKNIDATCENCE